MEDDSLKRLIAEFLSGNSARSPFELKFDNYVWKGGSSKLQDNLSVVYFFYSIRKNVAGKDFSHLLYIGKALDLKVRIRQHEVIPKNFPGQGSVDKDKLEDYLCDPQEVTRKCFYAYALVDGRKLERYEAAAIHVFNPELNKRNVQTFGGHVETWFKCSGKYNYTGDAIHHVAKD